MRLPLFATAIVAVAAGFTSQAAAQDATPDETTVLARVNGEEITRADLDEVIARLGPQAQQAPLQLVFDQVMDRLISQQLLGAAGRAEGLADDAEVQARMVEVQDAIIQQIYVERFLAAQVSDAAVQARYEETIGNQAPDVEVQASHILVSDEAVANEIIAELAGGADFATVAQEKSEGPSASRGGDLGYFRRGDMVPPFSEAAFALEPGETTEAPVQTQFGWHVIQVVDRRDVVPPTLEESRDQITQQIQQESIGTLLSDLRADATIERFGLDGAPLDAN